MSTLSKARIVVVGAGALGLACAVAAARAGAQVTVVDPQPLAANASGIAAGMLAPALEAILDETSTGQFGRLAAARDLWRSFADGLGPVGLDACGAILNGTETFLNRAEAALATQGARTERLDAGLYTPEDWRLEPRLALAALRAGLSDLGGAYVQAEVRGLDQGRVALAGGAHLDVDDVVLACGFGGQALAEELAVLAPIRGQLLRFDEAGPREGPILRNATAYLAPSLTGAVVGATMDMGRTDLAVDPEASERLRAEAARLQGPLAWASSRALVGVRAATPDGLPLIGPARQSRVWIASGARRNGWLYAPLVAEMIVGQIMGNEGGAWEAAAFAPSRFPLVSAGTEYDGDADL